MPPNVAGTPANVEKPVILSNRPPPGRFDSTSFRHRGVPSQFHGTRMPTSSSVGGAAEVRAVQQEMPPNNRLQLTRSAPLQGRLAPPSQLNRVLCGHGWE